MKIFIPTRGRIGNQLTLEAIKHHKPIIVAPQCEAHHWSNPLVVSDAWNFSQIRQFILQQPGKRHVVFDDDLRFVRRTEGTTLRQTTPRDIDEMFDWIRAKFDEGFIHGGISARQGNNWVKDSEKQIGREVRAHFYDADYVRATPFDFRNVQLRQDFHFTLSMLRRGEPNVICYEFAQDQANSDTPGGCSRYRTPQLMEEQAYALQALHPDYVKVVKKETKGSWGGGVRTDVSIRWLKAFECG